MSASDATASKKTLEALDQTQVRLSRVCSAAEVIDLVGPRHFLHGGPPIGLDELPGPMRGALIGALMFEGEARSQTEAQEIVDSGELELTPCHDAAAVGAMAGIVSPRMPGMVAHSNGRTIFSPLNEGLGRALRFGSHDAETLARLEWMAEVAAPILDAAISDSEEIELTELISEGLRRGDECHNRNVATTGQLVMRLAAAIARVAPRRQDAADVFSYAATNRHFALSFSIGTAKAIADAGHGIEGSPIVTAIAGNGRRLGIRVSGAQSRWFLTPAPLGDARYFEGFTEADATPIMGDSMIAETVGYGAFALTAAPAITSFVGGTAEQSRGLIREMRAICAGESTRFRIPGEDFRGTPMGIDVHRVRDRGIAPFINNGIAHKEPGRGQVGAGLTRLPIEPFIEASMSLLDTTVTR